MPANTGPFFFFCCNVKLVGDRARARWDIFFVKIFVLEIKKKNVYDEMIVCQHCRGIFYFLRWGRGDGINKRIESVLQKALPAVIRFFR